MNLKLGEPTALDKSAYLTEVHSGRETYGKINNNYSKVGYEIVKRVIDISMSLFALIMLLPISILIIIFIKKSSKGPAIYRHKRIGTNGKEFNLYKFRSMICTDKPLDEIFTKEQMEQYKRDYKVDNDPRITKIGDFLRKTSLDELPQLINILLGQMSIVGPRPVLQEETEFYGKNRDLFLSVKPGLTGYWQANGRSNTSYEERKSMELYYVNNRSLVLDVKIIFKTVFVVLCKKGAK